MCTTAAASWQCTWGSPTLMAAILARGATPTMPRPLSAAAAALAHLQEHVFVKTISKASWHGNRRNDGKSILYLYSSSSSSTDAARGDVTQVMTRHTVATGTDRCPSVPGAVAIVVVPGGGRPVQHAAQAADRAAVVDVGRQICSGSHSPQQQTVKRRSTRKRITAESQVPQVPSPTGLTGLLTT